MGVSAVEGVVSGAEVAVRVVMIVEGCVAVLPSVVTGSSGFLMRSFVAWTFSGSCSNVLQVGQHNVSGEANSDTLHSRLHFPQTRRTSDTVPILF